jgi:hypothetical protein
MGGVGSKVVVCYQIVRNLGRLLPGIGNIQQKLPCARVELGLAWLNDLAL